MAEATQESSVFGLLSRLGMALSRRKFPPFYLKPLQVKFFEHVLKGLDVIAVLPTGFGKSLLFQCKMGLTGLHDSYGS